MEISLTEKKEEKLLHEKVFEKFLENGVLKNLLEELINNLHIDFLKDKLSLFDNDFVIGQIKNIKDIFIKFIKNYVEDETNVIINKNVITWIASFGAKLLENSILKDYEKFKTMELQNEIDNIKNMSNIIEEKIIQIIEKLVSVENDIFNKLGLSKINDMIKDDIEYIEDVIIEEVENISEDYSYITYICVRFYQSIAYVFNSLTSCCRRVSNNTNVETEVFKETEKK